MQLTQLTKLQQVGLAIALAVAIFAAGHAWLDRGDAIQTHDIARLTEDDTVVAIMAPAIGVPVMAYDAYRQMHDAAYTAGYVRGERDAAVATLQTLGASVAGAHGESSDAIALRLDRATSYIEARFIDPSALLAVSK